MYYGRAVGGSSCTAAASPQLQGRRLCITSPDCPSPDGTTGYSDPPDQPFVFCGAAPPAPAPSPPTSPPCTCVSYNYNGSYYDGTCAPGASSVTLGQQICVTSPACAAAAGTTGYSDPPNQPFIYCSAGSSPPSPPPGRCPCVDTYTYNGETYTGGECAPGASQSTAGRTLCVVDASCGDYWGTSGFTDPPNLPVTFCDEAAVPPSPPPSPPVGECDCLEHYTYNGETYSGGECAPGASAVTANRSVCIVSEGCTSAYGFTGVGSVWATLGGVGQEGR